MVNSDFNKEKVINVLKNILDEDQIVNINNFSNEILIDVIPSNPTHKAKKDLSNKIIDFLKIRVQSRFKLQS